jgi:hypothetical protein
MRNQLQRLCFFAIVLDCSKAILYGVLKWLVVRARKSKLESGMILQTGGQESLEIYESNHPPRSANANVISILRNRCTWLKVVREPAYMVGDISLLHAEAVLVQMQSEGDGMRSWSWAGGVH